MSHAKLLQVCCALGVIFAAGVGRTEEPVKPDPPVPLKPPERDRETPALKDKPPAPDENGYVWRSANGWPAWNVGAPSRGTYQISERRLKIGDDPRWARPDWDDRDWEEIPRQGLPTRTGIFWVHYRVRSTAQLPAGIYQKVAAAYELYWDGRPLGHSGKPADNRAGEVTGKLDRTFSIPDEWRGAGEHLVALRMSTHRAGFPGPLTDLQIWFSAPENQVMSITRVAIKPALGEGAMLMIAVGGLAMWSAAARRITLLLFVGLCLCAAATQALTVQRFAYNYTYDWHYPARLVSMYASGAMGACLLAFVGLHFGVPRWRWLLLLFIATFIGLMAVPEPVFYLPLGEKSGLVIAIGFVVAVIPAGWAFWRQRPGAWAVAAGALVSAIAAWRRRPALLEDGSFFPVLLPVLLGLAFAVALQLRMERQRAHATQLAAARLETELLKKNLQPHFLLNTLTALSEVVEQDPPGAVRLINDLAGEFRSLTRMSGEKRVLLGQELDLCRAHLRIMSVRTNVAWSLDATGVDESAPVPPAIFLTLIENGFAHQRVTAVAALFVLRRMALPGDEVRYTFLSPGEVRTELVRAPGGTGLRYVRARLEESFPGAWTLTQQAAAGGWETVIELRAGAGENNGRSA